MNMRIILPTVLSVICAAWTAPAAADKLVARVRVHNPGDALQGVVVRGSLPLPADFEGAVSRLALSDKGQVLATQVSVFSTYAGSSKEFPVGRPEVVQLASRVNLGKSAVKTFDVVQLAAAPEAAPSAKGGKALAGGLAGSKPVLVEATDCFGNRYRAGAPTSRSHGPGR